MEEARRNIWVGLFVLTGLAALGVLVVLFGKTPTWLGTRGVMELHIRFDEVADIREGNLVTAKGITIGRVVQVDLVDPSQFDAGVDVLVHIDSQYSIHEGARALATEAVLGQGRPPIQIIPGDRAAALLVAGATLRGEMRTALDSIFPPGVVDTLQTSARQIGDAAEALTPVLREFEQMIQVRSLEDVDGAVAMQGNLSTAVVRLDSALKHFNEVLGDPTVKSQVREFVANAHDISERGKKMMTDLEAAAAESRTLMADARQLVGKVDGAVGNAEARINEVARSAVDTLDKLDQFMDFMNVAGRQVASGEGNLGRFVMDDRLYESLVITADRLGQAVEEFRALIAQWQEGRIKVAL